MVELMVDQVIKLKRNTSNTTAPTTSDIVVGEIAVSAVDGKLYIRKQDDSIKAIDANEDDVIALAIALG
jgi:DNA-binding beta-propeller fold protein YncE